MTPGAIITAILFYLAIIIGTFIGTGAVEDMLPRGLFIFARVGAFIIPPIVAFIAWWTSQKR